MCPKWWCGPNWALRPTTRVTNATVMECDILIRRNPSFVYKLQSHGGSTVTEFTLLQIAVIALVNFTPARES